MYPWAELRLLFSSLAVVLKTIQLITSMDVWQTSKICWKWTFFFFGLICSDSVSASRLGWIKSFWKVKCIFKNNANYELTCKGKKNNIRILSMMCMYLLKSFRYFFTISLFSLVQLWFFLARIQIKISKNYRFH